MLTVNVTASFFVEIFHKALRFPLISLSFINTRCVVSWQKWKYFSWFSSGALTGVQAPNKNICLLLSSTLGPSEGFFSSCDRVNHLHWKHLTCRSSDCSSDFFRLIWICPLPRLIWNCCIKSWLFPGAIKSFLVPPAALTHTLLFTAFNVGNSGI